MRDLNLKGGGMTKKAFDDDQINCSGLVKMNNAGISIRENKTLIAHFH